MAENTRDNGKMESNMGRVCISTLEEKKRKVNGTTERESDGFNHDETCFT
jgi:hypothetical protein